MKSVLIAAALLLTCTLPALAQSPALEEVDALKIGKLIAERLAIAEKYQRLRAEALAQWERTGEVTKMQGEFQSKTDGLNGLIEEAAKKAKLDVKDVCGPAKATDCWEPDADKRVWHKRKEK